MSCIYFFAFGDMVTDQGAAQAYPGGNATTQETVMSLLIGQTAPDFEADTTTGPIRFHDWICGDWVFFFSHPADFTPVCTTEMGRTAQLAEAFAARSTKPLGPVDRHGGGAPEMDRGC